MARSIRVPFLERTMKTDKIWHVYAGHYLNQIEIAARNHDKPCWPATTWIFCFRTWGHQKKKQFIIFPIFQWHSMAITWGVFPIFPRFWPSWHRSWWWIWCWYSNPISCSGTGSEGSVKQFPLDTRKVTCGVRALIAVKYYENLLSLAIKCY